MGGREDCGDYHSTTVREMRGMVALHTLIEQIVNQ